MEMGEFSSELGVYAYAAAQVKKALEVKCSVIKIWNVILPSLHWVPFPCNFWYVIMFGVFFPFERLHIIWEEKIMFSGVAEKDIRLCWIQIWRKSLIIW